MVKKKKNKEEEMRDVYANEEAIPSFFSIVSFAAVALQGATGHRLTSSTADPVRRRAPKKKTR